MIANVNIFLIVDVHRSSIFVVSISHLRHAQFILFFLNRPPYGPPKNIKHLKLRVYGTLRNNTKWIGAKADYKYLFSEIMVSQLIGNSTGTGFICIGENDNRKAIIDELCEYGSEAYVAAAMLH